MRLVDCNQMLKVKDCLYSFVKAQLLRRVVLELIAPNSILGKSIKPVMGLRMEAINESI